MLEFRATARRKPVKCLSPKWRLTFSETHKNPMKSQNHLLPQAIAIASACLASSLHAAPLDVIQEWNFNIDGNFEGWAENVGQNRLKGPLYDGVSNLTEEEVSGGVLRGKVIADDPQLLVGSLSLNSNLVGYVKMRYRVLDALGNPIVPPVADVVVPSPGGSQGTALTAPNTSVVVDAVNGWTENTWDLTDLSNTTITSLRVDPAGGLIDGGNGIFEIDSIQILETDTPPPLVIEVDPAAPLAAPFVLVKEWDSDTDWAKFTATNFTIDSIAGGVLTGTSTTIDANLSISAANFGTALPAPASGVLVFEYKLSQTNPTAGVFQTFWTDANGTSNAIRSVTTSAPADSAVHVYRVTLKDRIASQMTALRLDPNNLAAAGTSLDYFRIYVDPTPAGWDTNTVTAAAQGGTGTWNATDPFYFTGLVNKPWLQGGDMIFGATAGTVTVDAGGINANDLTFLSNSYTLTGGPLLLSGASSQLAASGGVTATLNVPISRPSVTAATDLLSLTGPGNFRFGGGGTIPRKWHIKTNTELTAGTFTSSGASEAASNGMVVFNGSTLTLSGATLNRTNGDGDDALYIGNPANTGDFASVSRAGNLVVNSGNLNVGGSVGRGLAIGFGGSNGSTMTVNGGNVTASSLYVGWNSAATLNVAGGIVSVNPTDATGVAIRHSDNGSGTINITSGELRAGNVWLGAGNAITSTVSLTVNLDGGILETERIRISKGSATGNFTLACNFDGGTLKLPAVAPAGTSGVLLGNVADDGGGTTAFITTLEDGGLVLDTNGRDTTITTILSHDATLGTALDGGLTKNGLGKLTLAVENTYTGETKVNAGVLAVNGSSIIDTGKLVISAGRVEVTGTETVGSLFFGSVQQAAGIWGSSASTAVAPFVDDTRFSGNGVVIVDTGTGASYASWAAGFSAPALADPAAMADPDVDGLANSVEYVIGGDPRISSQAGRPVSSVSGGNLVFTFYRVDSSETPDASVSVQTSNDLADWTTSPVYSVGADTLSSSAGVVVAENGANPDFITVTIPAASKKFARLSVMTP